MKVVLVSLVRPNLVDSLLEHVSPVHKPVSVESGMIHVKVVPDPQKKSVTAWTTIVMAKRMRT